MRNRVAKIVTTVGAAAAIGVSGATFAFASNGGDDPPNHERHHHHHCRHHHHHRHCEPGDDHGRGGHHRGHDDGHRGGHDDGPNHT